LAASTLRSACLVVAAGTFLGCTRKSGATGELSAVSSSGSSAGSKHNGSPTSALATATAAPAPITNRPKLDLLLEITRDADSGEETLWGSLPSLGIRQAIGHSIPPFVCGISVTPSETNIVPPRPSRRTRVDCGKPTDSLAITLDGERLRLGNAELQVPPDSFIVHEALQQPLPPEPECGDSPRKHIAVSISRGGHQLLLKIPALKLVRKLHELNDDKDPLYCRSTVLAAARRMDLVCSAGRFNSQSTHLAVQRDVLFVENGSEDEIDGRVNRTRVGIQLPCNAEVLFKGYTHRTSNYFPLPDHCEGRCWIIKDACSRDCAERYSDARGELSEAGLQCSHTCRAKNDTCSSRCRAAASKL